jgi:hypothetical protein
MKLNILPKTFIGLGSISMTLELPLFADVLYKMHSKKEVEAEHADVAFGESNEKFLLSRSKVWIEVGSKQMVRLRFNHGIL